MVIKNLENKIKLVGIVCVAVIVGCGGHQPVKHLGRHGAWWQTQQQKIYVLDGNVPILVQRTSMEETLDVEAKAHVEAFHHYFFTLAPDDKYIQYTMEKAMYLVDETGLAQYNTLKEKGSLQQYHGYKVRCSASFVTVSSLTRKRWSLPITAGNVLNGAPAF